MDRKEVTRDTYDQIAEDYARRDKRREDEGPLVTGMLDYFIAKLSRGARVLDIGHGGGRDSRYLRKAGLEVVGIDNSQGMVEEASRVDPAGDYRLMDLEELRFEAQSFDGVWANASLHHAPREILPRILKDIFQILKVSGFLEVIVKQGDWSGVRENERFGRVLRRYFTFYQPEQLSSLLREAGFRVLSCTSEFEEEWVYALAREPRGEGQ